MDYISFWLFVGIMLLAAASWCLEEHKKPNCHYCGGKCSGEYQLSFTDSKRDIPTITVNVCRPCWHDPASLPFIIMDISKGD